MTDVYKPKFTDNLRTRARAVFGTCPTCGHAMGTTREIGEEVGVNNTTIWRFLKGGKPSADLVDRLVDWLDEHEEPVP